MGIITEEIEETEIPEGVKIADEIIERNPSGTFDMSGYIIGWELDLSSNIITLNIPDLGTKVLNETNTVAEYRIDEPWYKKFLAKISSDFKLKQLLLNGYVTYLTGSPRPRERVKRKKYENVIIITW